MKFFSFLILYLILTVTLPAKDPKPQYFVDAKGGLHLREEPSEKSKSILLIPDKSEIKILKEVGDTVKLNEKSGRWTEILFGSKKGFVFGAYIRKYFLLDKKFSPNNKLFYDYYTPAANHKMLCNYHDVGIPENECFIKIYNSRNKKLVRLLNSNSSRDSEDKIWFGTSNWYDNKSLLIADILCDGLCSTSIGYLNIDLRTYFSILKKEMMECNNRNITIIEQVEFNRITYYKIESKNPKFQTGYFTMIKPIADDYDKLLETCKRNPKNSVLVKSITIVRKNYTFKINSKRAALYFKGKDILKLEE
jgi:hypothetical protein